MKKSKLEIVKGALGLLICIGAVLGIYFWETYGRTEYTKANVVVLKESVQALTVITEEHLIIEKREVADLIDSSIVHKGDIIGKVSKHFIPAKSQLSEAFFEVEGVLPREGEYIFQMPKSWIASIPSTLRRSDDAYLYPIQSGEVPQVSLTQMSLDKLVSSKTVSKDPIKCLKIAFVRNQSNQEVQSLSETDRLDANSVIASIEVIATIEDIHQLNALRKAGYSFIVMYR